MAKDFDDFMEIVNSDECRDEEIAIIRDVASRIVEDQERVTTVQLLAIVQEASVGVSLRHLRKYHEWLSAE